MDISSSIASASIGLNQAKLMQMVGIAVAKKVMNHQETQAAALIEQLQSAAPPSNHRLDARA